MKSTQPSQSSTPVETRHPNKITTREVAADNIQYTLSQLNKLDVRWKFSHTKQGYNFYTLLGESE